MLDMTMKVHEWLKDLGPLFVSLAVFWVTCWFSRWQVRLAQQKLRHDLYDRRFAIYMAFQELLLAFVDAGESDDEIRAAYRKAYVARSEAPFLLADPQIEAYLEDLCKQVKERVIGPIMFIQSSEGAMANDPQMRREVAERASRLGTAKLDLADRHLGELSQQFARFLELTDFWE
jgi:hypothetical protein